MSVDTGRVKCICFRTLKIVLVAGIVSLLLAACGTWVFFRFWVSPHYTDLELFQMAKGIVLQDHVKIQLEVDDLFSEMGLPLMQLKRYGDSYYPKKGSHLDVLCKRLSNLTFVGDDCGYILGDCANGKIPIVFRYGTPYNFAWLAIYQSCEEVSDIPNIRWITEHIGVIDELSDFLHCLEYGKGEIGTMGLTP